MIDPQKLMTLAQAAQAKAEAAKHLRAQADAEQECFKVALDAAEKAKREALEAELELVRYAGLRP